MHILIFGLHLVLQVFPRHLPPVAPLGPCTSAARLCRAPSGRGDWISRYPSMSTYGGVMFSRATSRKERTHAAPGPIRSIAFSSTTAASTAAHRDPNLA